MGEEKDDVLESNFRMDKEANFHIIVEFKTRVFKNECLKLVSVLY